MSFILDALKKSEEQRKGTAPPRTIRRRTLRLQTSSQSGRGRWAWLLLIPIIVWGGWLLRKQIVDEPTALTATRQNVTAPVEKPTRLATSQPGPGPAPVPVRFEATTVRRSPPQVDPTVVTAPTARSLEPSLKGQKPGSQGIATEPLVAAKIETVELAPVEQTALPRYINLSRDDRTRVPQLSMSMHFFTEPPERRLVRINNRILHEGDQLTDELSLVEVTPNGAILDYLGLLFEMRGPGS